MLWRMELFPKDYETIIIRFVNAYIHNMAEAEDICYDTFVAFIEKFNNPVMADDQGVLRWLLKTAKHKTLNYLKRASTRYEVLDSRFQELAGEKQRDKKVDDVQRAMLYEYLTFLNDVEYQVITKRIREIPYEQLEKETGKSRHALECIYSRGVKKLKSLVSKKGSMKEFEK